MPFALVAGLGFAVVLFVVSNVAATAMRSSRYPRYWRDRMNEPVAPNAVRLVALGDSSVEAIGADRPMDGYVGRIADYISTRTGRPVHIVNVSSGGKARDPISTELPKVDVTTADLVVVADSNDMQGRVLLDRYRDDLTELMEKLPADRTVISDLPIFPGAAPYREVLRQVAEAFGVQRADFVSVFNSEGRRLDVFSWLPPHLNSRGYYYWFKAFQPKVDVVIGRWEAARRLI